MKDVVWGIIGCGDVVEKKSGPAFQTSQNSSLLAVMRRNRSKAKDFAIKHNVPLYFDDAKQILNHQEINSVYIATPPSSHLQYALEALKANKNVYLEKPMVLDANESIVLCEAVKNSNSKLTIAHYRRQLPMFLKIKQLVDQNVLGKINSVELKLFQSRAKHLMATTPVNWRLNPAISGGGYYHDLAPHQLDLLLYWFGPIKDFSGQAFSEGILPNVATKINGVINFENGISCKASWDFMVSEMEQKDECVIKGSIGFIRFPIFGNKIHQDIAGKKDTIKFEHPKYIQHPMVQTTVNYFLGKNKNPCAAEEALQGMQIIDAFTK